MHPSAVNGDRAVALHPVTRRRNHHVCHIDDVGGTAVVLDEIGRPYRRAALGQSHPLILGAYMKSIIDNYMHTYLIT